MWKWILIGVLVVVLVFVAQVVAATRRALRRRNARFRAMLAELDDEGLSRLAGECQAFFRSSFGVDLDFDRWEESALAIDAALKDPAQRQIILQGLYRREVANYWILPLGAYLGELIRRHTNAAWKSGAADGPQLEISVDGGTMIAFPFLQAPKHMIQGEPGDLVGFINTNLHLEQLIAHLDREDSEPGPAVEDR